MALPSVGEEGRVEIVLSSLTGVQCLSSPPTCYQLSLGSKCRAAEGWERKHPVSQAEAVGCTAGDPGPHGGVGVGVDVDVGGDVGAGVVFLVHPAC